MNSKCYCTGWSLVAGLAASVLALPSLAAALTLDEALQLAENNAPSLTAQDAKIQAASSAAIPAGELPDPKLLLGVQNYPIGGPDRWSIDQDFMTMRMVGVSQEMPNSAKRKARIEVADAAIDRAAAERRVERLKVRQATALAWINSYSVERKDALFQDFYKENRLLADTVRAQIAGGRAQPADAVTPKQEAAQLEEQQDDLIRQRAQARAALKRWIGPAANDKPVGSLPEWPVEASDYSHKLQHHPELAAFAPMTREAQAKVREAEAEKQSDWSWEVDYQNRGRQFGDMVSVQFSWDLPLFPDSRQNPKIAAKHAELNQLEAEREALSREHTQQLEDELADYERLNRAVHRTQDSLLPLAKEKVELSMASYRAGKGDLSSVVAARRELIEARLKQIDVEEQRALTSARLYFAYGESSQ
ncbi:TolC family protein [Pseudomonas umsongensis]|jgi:outer membrane protein, heavy metal efflux system|uniref:TolC family protein n=1 Tax=Pseudomonas TaxID=286 RepID=UPI0006546A29|nr:MULTISPECIES: TolC family protein [Pseudomonas]KMM82231.1 cytochrome C [Pseudomonas lundensis]NMX62334.1 TolC family protein [Pseudomonas sp. WS 5079]NNA23521.1 TolC family protein [Pseudomonas lundensis]QFG29454.1 TolC family protein [Pseudomonas umsongensis]QIH09025.1 TolC family protein [Pseudomonas sp. BIOMIG1BAC]